MKTCTKCGETKPESAYNRHNGIKCGLQPSCRTCQNAQSKAWKVANPEAYAAAIAAWWKRHPEKKKAKDARRKANNPEYFTNYYLTHKDECHNRSAASYQANKPKRRVQQRAWAKANKERALENQARWRRENPEKTAEYNHRRRAARRELSGKHIAAELKSLFDSQSGRCANHFCGADLRVTKKHLDHIKPVKKGGSNGIENLQWLCFACNLSKGSREQDEWLADRYGAEKIAA